MSALQETGFVEYLDVGTWYLAFYNDGRKMEQVVVYSTPIGKAVLESAAVKAYFIISILIDFNVFSF